MSFVRHSCLSLCVDRYATLSSFFSLLCLPLSLCHSLFLRHFRVNVFTCNAKSLPKLPKLIDNNWAIPLVIWYFSKFIYARTSLLLLSLSLAHSLHLSNSQFCCFCRFVSFPLLVTLIENHMNDFHPMFIHCSTICSHLSFKRTNEQAQAKKRKTLM